MSDLQNNNVSVAEEEDVSLLDILTVIGEQKSLILGLTLAASLLAVVVTLVMTPVFTARTLVMPPQQKQSSAASSLASLGALAGVATSIKSPDDMYVSFMTSEVFQRKIIERFKLMERYHCAFVVDCRQSLNQHARIVSDKKSTLMAIEVDDPDPNFAASMANAFVEELDTMIGRLAVTEAQQRRVYFESQIKKTENELALAETQFRNAQHRSGLQVPTVEAETGVKEIAEMHGQIAAREIQLQALNSYATPNNSDVKKLVTELGAMKAHLLRLERGSLDTSNPEGVQQEAIQVYRNMKVQESMLEAFAKQYELAKVDESKEGALVQVVDPAYPPERRSSPKRTQLVLTSALGGFVFAIVLAFFRIMIRKASESTEGLAKLKALKRAWRL
jgi:tyrosine-protein kinase Etk/Wzc